MIGSVLAPAAAYAAVQGAAAPRQPHAVAAGAMPASNPTTTVTFTVTSGALTMTAPASSYLGAGGDGGTISGSLGTITVTDDRGLLTTAWTATVAETDFKTGGGTPPETIPATSATYVPGTISTVGTITVAGTNITLSNGAQTVVAGSAGVGDNDASWNPTVAVSVGSIAIGGLYTGTMTHSVS